MIIPNKSYSLLQCQCSCHFFMHSSLYCAVKPCVRKLKEYKNTQPLIGMPEPLPETGVLANHSWGKFERNERMTERMKERQSLGLFTIRCRIFLIGLHLKKKREIIQQICFSNLSFHRFV